MLKTLKSSRGMVTAPHHLAVQSGIAVLRDGGNAVEAMVAAAATIAVVYPHMNSIGGDGFWLISQPGKPPVGIDACGASAASADISFYKERGLQAIPARGPLAANTVAGALSGWDCALRLGGGHLPLARLLEDAIWYARHGVPITCSQVSYTTKFLPELLGQPGFDAAYLQDGKPPEAGTLQRFPALAATLERLSRHGLDDFYRGDSGVALAGELRRLGSPLTLADLNHHNATLVQPLQMDLRSGTAYNLPPPTQGIASLAILGIFDRLKVSKAETFEHIHGLVEATKQAFLARGRIGDPATMADAPADFLSAEALARSVSRLNLKRARPWPAAPAKGDTVWMGAADRDGRVVSYIQSVYWEFGSGVVLRDTGVSWQNRGSSFTLDPAQFSVVRPRRKPFHTLNPALAHLADGRRMAYGTMGGDGQPQSQAALFTRHVMFGQELQQAVSAPRWLLGRTWGDMSVSLKVESRVQEEIVNALRLAGHNVEVIEPYSDLVGHAGAVCVDREGIISAASDPRSDGVVAGF
jgi:oxamate amidohydrolase